MASAADAGLRSRCSADAVGAVLGAGEDEHALHGGIGQQLQRAGRALPAPATKIDALLDAIDRAIVAGETSTRTGIAEDLGGELARSSGGMVAENSSVCRSLRHGGDDLADVADEAHVEHAVGLVEDEDRDAVEPHVALGDQIEQPAGRGDQDIDAALRAP